MKISTEEYGAMMRNKYRNNKAVSNRRSAMKIAEIDAQALIDYKESISSLEREVKEVE